MAVTVLGVFDDALAARRALEALRDSPVPIEDISIISRQTEDGEPVSNAEDVSAGEGAAVGAVWGGLVGLSTLLIPGIGPFIAGGALFAALTGAVTGAVVGGVTAALMDFSGIPEAEARQYEEFVRNGRTLVIAKLDAQDANEARRILATYGADELHQDELGAAGTSVETAPRRTGGVQVAMYENGVRIDAPSDTSIASSRTSMIEPGLGSQPVVPRAPGGTEPIISSSSGVPDTGPSAGPTDTGSDRPSNQAGGTQWTSGEWVGEGQGSGPRPNTGTYDTRQWVGEGQGSGPVQPDSPAKQPAPDPDTNLPDTERDASKRKI